MKNPTIKTMSAKTLANLRAIDQKSHKFSAEWWKAGFVPSKSLCTESLKKVESFLKAAQKVQGLKPDTADLVTQVLALATKLSSERNASQQVDYAQLGFALYQLERYCNRIWFREPTEVRDQFTVRWVAKAPEKEKAPAEKKAPAKSKGETGGVTRAKAEPKAETTSATDAAIQALLQQVAALSATVGTLSEQVAALQQPKTRKARAPKAEAKTDER